MVISRMRRLINATITWAWIRVLTRQRLHGWETQAVFSPRLGAKGPCPQGARFGITGSCPRTVAVRGHEALPRNSNHHLCVAL